MKKEITVVLDNHPFAREYNWLGGAVDIKNHNWVHVNVKFLAKPEKYEELLIAFSTQTPFELLGWVGDSECPTKTISRWAIRESPVAKQEGDSLWLAFECLERIPEHFFQYLANQFQIHIRTSYCPPHARKWLIKAYESVENIKTSQRSKTRASLKKG
jgi:hypothetical protein